MTVSTDFHLDGDDDRYTVAVHTYSTAGNFATVRVRNAAGDYVTVFTGTPDKGRDLAAALVAAARDLDEWADTVDPQPDQFATDDPDEMAYLLAEQEGVAS